MSHRTRLSLRLIPTLIVLLALVLQPASLAAPAPTRPAAPANVRTTEVAYGPEARANAARLLLEAPNTVAITAAGIQPDVIEVTVDTPVTFVNQDTVTRRIVIATEGTPPGSTHRVYLPLVLRPGPQATAGGSTAAQTGSPAAQETIVLNPGASVQRTFAAPGNRSVTDAANPAIKATILVTPASLSTDGVVSGAILDYKTKLPLVGATVKALDSGLQATTGADGAYNLALPPGEHTLVMFNNGHTFANRKVAIQPYTPVLVDTVELVPLDAAVVPITPAGGTAMNSAGNTNVVFAAGAVTTTKAIRLTELSVDEFQGDFAALPGPFTDGSIPMGFVMFEPDGTHFEGPATWTIEYTGTLPVGTWVPCYYWIEDEARWGDPVDGSVVDLGNGKKGLRAVLPHFSAYGFAPPPPPEPKDPVVPTSPNPGDPPGPDDNRNCPDKDTNCGSTFNLASGELGQAVGTAGLPNFSGLPTQVTANYRSLDFDPTQAFSFTLGIAPGSLTPKKIEWSFAIAGRTFRGLGPQVSVRWDGRGPGSKRLPPGLHMGTFTAAYTYDVLSVSQPGGGAVFCAGICGIVTKSVSVSWPLSVVREDLSPFGLGWFGPHDTLLVDRGGYVTILQGDGRELRFERQTDGSYTSPTGDFTILTHNPDGTWSRQDRQGNRSQFNADGRLTRIEDRRGNYQLVLYESNGKTIPAGEWGLSTRIHRIVDSAGNSFDYAYDANNWLASITDSNGRIFRYEHDAAGYMTASVDPLGHRQIYAYNAQGLMTAHTDARNQATTYIYDAQGRLVSRTWPTGTTLQVTYTDKQVRVLTDRGTPVITTLDDKYNPVASYNGVYTATVTYTSQHQPQSSDSPPWLALYDANGNLIDTVGLTATRLERSGPYDLVTRVTGSNGTNTAITRDAAGNPTSFTDALGQTYVLTYDAHGLMTSITDPLGNQTGLAYDARGELASLTDSLNRTFTFEHDAAGNLTRQSDPLNRTTRMEYDALNQLAAVVDALNGRTTLAYDSNGNLTVVTDPSGRATSFVYDALDRATSITYPASAALQFGYDPLGNLTQYSDGRGVSTSYTYDPASRLTGKSVTGDPAVAYTYDRLDRLTGVDEGALQRSYAYLPDNSEGLLLRSTQAAAGLPLNVTVDYQYSGGLIDARLAGAAALSANALVSTAAITATGDAAPQPDVSTGALPANDPVAPEEEPVRSDPSAGSGDESSAAPALACDATLSGNIATSQTLTPLDANPVYCFNNSATITAGTTITVPAGVQLAGAGGSLTVRGKLVLNGAAGNPAVLTSLNDAPPGGANSGFQYTVNVNGNGRFEMRQAEMRYAGYINNSSASHLALSDNAVALVENSKLGLGGWWNTIRAANASSLTLTDSQVRTGYNIPLNLTNTGATAITGSTFYVPAVSGEASRVNPPGVAGLLNGGNVFTSTTGLPASYQLHIINGDPIVSDTVWNGRGDGNTGISGLHFISVLQVRNGAALTIRGPWDIRGAGQFSVGAANSAEGGALRLLGAPGQPVHIFSDGASCSYSGVLVYQNGLLETGYADLNGVSGCSDRYSVVRVGQGGQATLEHTDVHNGAAYGLRVDNGGRLSLTNSRVFNNGTFALFADPNAGPIQIAGTEVFGHRNPSVHTVFLPANSGGNLGAGIRLHDNTYNFITLHGSVTGDVSLSPPPGGVYLVSTSITVNSGARLAIPPGSELRVRNGLVVQAGGRLEANGAPNAPIRLTTFGGAWAGLSINGGTVALSHTLVENSTSHGITIDPDGELSVTNSLIARNVGWGINVRSAGRPVTIRNSSFVGNGSGAVNRPASGTVQATHNYWGSSSGPKHASNPGGVGQAVGDGVNFQPFSPAFIAPGNGRLSGFRVGSNANPDQAQQFTYDAIGQLTALSSSGYVTYTLAYAYDAAGHLVSRTPALNAPLAYGFAYDAADQLTRIDVTNAQAAATLLTLDYTYDAAGNITGIASSRDGAATYTYDALNRLTGVSSPDFNAAYAYDAAGNRTQAGGVAYTYDAGGRLIGASDGTAYTYDADGNLATRTQGGQTTAFTWDGQGRLVRIDHPDGTFSQYTYDDAGRRTSKRKPDDRTVYYVYAGVLLAQELDASGQVLASYTYDGLDRPISMWRGGQSYYYLLDHLGSVLGLTDAAGSVVATYHYDPWGNLLSSTGTVENPLRFTAREFDAESGLYFYRARYYDPQTGRFVSRDPVGFRGGMNLYAYASNVPTYQRDPFGQETEEEYRQLVGDNEYDITEGMTPEEREIYWDDVAAEQLLGPEEYAKYQKMTETEWKDYIAEEAYKQLVGEDLYEQTKDMSDRERRDFFDEMAKQQEKDEEKPGAPIHNPDIPRRPRPEEPLFC